ncbi:MAG: M13 family metallopeptidase [Proteobacteria bacterium]|nr:M13 family metallopeptidase [Pseudomonadota bacterium]
MRLAYLAAVSAAAILSGTLAATAALAGPAYGAWGVDLSARDASVKPGDDFFAYANGTWDKTVKIPDDQGSTGVGYDVYNKAQDELRAIIETSAKAPKTATARQIGALYNSFMDEARVEALDAKPMQADLAAIAAVKDRAAFTRLMAESHAGMGASLFGLQQFPDAKTSSVNALYIGQDGLGMPDRDYYLTEGFKPQRDAYAAYLARTFTAIGYPDPEGAAKAVLAFETRVAEVSWPSDERRDIDKLYNPMSVAQLNAYAPEVDWGAYLAAVGLPGKTEVVLAEKSAVQKIAKLYGETPLETLKAWETFRLVDNASPYLSKRFADSRFEFRSHALQGTEAQRPRWKRGVQLVDGSLGEALGREYVDAQFPPESKAAMEQLVANLKTAMAARIDRLSWMAPSTKAQAKDKLARMQVLVGYPNKWRDYSRLSLDAGDLYGNVKRSSAFEWAFQMAHVDKPVDAAEWGMTPQTVNAYNGGLENKIVFPAAILQAPFFDPKADLAVNYGAIGAIIGHEITHGFDDQGRKIDATGSLRDWWAPEDAARFEAEAKKLGGQYDSYEAVPGSHINGKLTMGENIADLGGLLVAIDAYHKALGGKPAPVIDGLTGDQRFLMAFAQAWRDKARADSLKQQMASDPHSPSQFRAIGPTRNIDLWYAAFDVQPGQRYYLKPEDRVRIW